MTTPIPAAAVEAVLANTNPPYHTALSHREYVERIIGLALPHLSGWRPIAEAPSREPVIVFDLDWSIRIATKENERWWSGCDSYGNDRELDRATHWQPLPPPPGQEVDGV